MALPFNFFYFTNKLRKNYYASINKYSWKNYSYLIKNSLNKFPNISYSTYFDNLYISGNLFNGISDNSI